MKSDVISNIVPDSNPWKDRIYLTFDIDWAHDDVLNYTIDLVESYDVCATWFVTHETPILDRLRANPNFELGVHPNFNPLLNGSLESFKNAYEVLTNILSIVPEAVSVRSHSMTQNTYLLQIFRDAGLTHDSNHFIPSQSKMVLLPWRLWNGLIKCPYFWEDDLHCLFKDHSVEIDDLIQQEGLKIFDFHPIHVFLNTESLDRYECTRPFHHSPKELIKHSYEGYGTRNRLIELLKLAKSI